MQATLNEKSSQDIVNHLYKLRNDFYQLYLELINLKSAEWYNETIKSLGNYEALITEEHQKTHFKKLLEEQKGLTDFDRTHLFGYIRTHCNTHLPFLESPESTLADTANQDRLSLFDYLLKNISEEKQKQASLSKEEEKIILLQNLWTCRNAIASQITNFDKFLLGDKLQTIDVNFFINMILLPSEDCLFFINAAFNKELKSIIQKFEAIKEDSDNIVTKSLSSEEIQSTKERIYQYWYDINPFLQEKLDQFPFSPWESIDPENTEDIYELHAITSSRLQWHKEMLKVEFINDESNPIKEIGNPAVIPRIIYCKKSNDLLQKLLANPTVQELDQIVEQLSNNTKETILIKDEIETYIKQNKKIKASTLLLIISNFYLYKDHLEKQTTKPHSQLDKQKLNLVTTMIPFFRKIILDKINEEFNDKKNSENIEKLNENTEDFILENTIRYLIEIQRETNKPLEESYYTIQVDDTFFDKELCKNITIDTIKKKLPQKSINLEKHNSLAKAREHCRTENENQFQKETDKAQLALTQKEKPEDKVYYTENTYGNCFILTTYNETDPLKALNSIYITKQTVSIINEENARDYVNNDKKECCFSSPIQYKIDYLEKEITRLINEAESTCRDLKIQALEQLKSQLQTEAVSLQREGDQKIIQRWLKAQTTLAHKGEEWCPANNAVIIGQHRKWSLARFFGFNTATTRNLDKLFDGNVKNAVREERKAFESSFKPFGRA